MYCDFCGKNLSYNVKYCRYCGRQLKEGMGDTQPLPMIDEIILHNIKKTRSGAVPWYKKKIKVNQLLNKPMVWKVLHCLFAFVILVTTVYIVVTFTTIQEYQILFGIVGSLFATYSWWRGY